VLTGTGIRLACSSSLAGAALGLSAVVAEAEVLIGLAAPLTGDLAWHGEVAEQALTLAIDRINEAGGVLGEAVEVLSVDDFADPEQAVVAARRLVDAGVAVVIGHLPQALPCRPRPCTRTLAFLSSPQPRPTQS
jgi:branched-chain amino acid transport system substrate-binding protein